MIRSPAARVAIRSTWAAVAALSMGWRGVAAAGDSGDRDAVIRTAVAAGERTWGAVADADPGPDFSVRWPLSYALALCTARAHADRVPRLLDLATRMQDRDPASGHRGNFRWYWRDARVTDTNAVEFCGLDLHLLWRLHRDRLPEQARKSLDDLARQAIDGCLGHRVRPSYTNIAVLNAANLITLGEALGVPAAADEGYRRLTALAVDTWRFGLHEYCSPVYYAVDIEGLQAIERFAKRESGRELAGRLLELIWTDIAANWHPPARRLAGPHSRSYDYLHGGGGLVHHLCWEGWLEGPPRGGPHLVHVLDGGWRPPAHLHDMARTRFPRLVRQSWGPLAAESRTHWLLADVTLGCAGAGYGPDDSPLTFDLAGAPDGVRGYFIPDGRQDPYGRVRYPTGSAGHPKPLHLRPFWAGAQRTRDALGLVVYRDADLAAPEVRVLQSHVVFPRDVDGLWLRGRPLGIDDLIGTADRPVRTAVQVGDPLVLRKGSAAVGVRVAWARARDGKPGEIALVGDGNEWAALRLTVDHRRDAGQAMAGAAVWVRVGGGLDDESFAAWRKSFEQAEPAAVAVSADRIHVAVAGVDGPVAVTASAPFSREGRVELEPPPSRAVLEVDGVDVGRQLLEQVEPLRGYAAALAVERVVEVPAEGGVAWEAESGLVLPAMDVVDDDAASGRRAVVVSATPAGSATWRLRAAHAGRHWLWARVRSMDPDSDSFRVVARDGDGQPIGAGTWHLARGPGWTWLPLRLDRAAAPTPLDLPSGSVELEFEPREAGAAVDALWITSDPHGRPPEP